MSLPQTNFTAVSAWRKVRPMASLFPPLTAPEAATSRSCCPATSEGMAQVRVGMPLVEKV